MPHSEGKNSHVPALGSNNFRSKGKFTFDLSDPRLKAAIASLPDDQRLLAIENFQRKALAPGSKEILQQLKGHKSVFSNETRAKLQQLRTKQASPSSSSLLVASTLPRVAPAVPARGLADTDDSDPTRLTASVKTPTGTFNDACGFPIKPTFSLCAVINWSALPRFSPSLRGSSTPRLAISGTSLRRFRPSTSRTSLVACRPTSRLPRSPSPLFSRGLLSGTCG